MEQTNNHPKQLVTYGILILIGILIAITWLPITDHIADADIDAGFNRALAAFGIAKLFNMIVSVFQSSQIGIFGATVTIGEVLDPINDLVEQFSNIMFLATVAFGIQKILVAVGGHIFVKSFITIIAIVVGYLSFSQRDIPQWIKSLLILLVLTRLAVPVATVASSAAYNTFLADSYQTSYTSLTNSLSQLESLATTNQLSASVSTQQAAPPQINEGWWSKTKSAFASVTSINANDAFSKAYDEFNARKNKAQQLGEQMTKDIATQVVVFLLQTLIFPIGLIWVLYRIGVSMMHRSRP